MIRSQILLFALMCLAFCSHSYVTKNPDTFEHLRKQIHERCENQNLIQCFWSIGDAYAENSSSK